MEWNSLDIIGASLLLAGVIDDLRSRKIHNSLILVLLFISVVSAYVLLGGRSWADPLYAFGLAFVFMIPLFGLKVWGGGDAKLFLAVSPLLIYQEMPIFLLMSFVWGALLGLLRAGLTGKLKMMAANLGSLFLHRKAPASEMLVKIPFSVALFFGFLSVIVLRSTGGLF